MARATANVEWRGEGLLFDGVSEGGAIVLASGDDPAGSGPSPTQLLLLGLGGCTGMDVVSILKKMRQPLLGLRVEVSGEKREDHPRSFTEMHVTYYVKGALDERKVRRAIELSEDRYCPVAATLRPGVRLTSSFVIEP
jgi:putative redox protein